MGAGLGIDEKNPNSAADSYSANARKTLAS